MRIPIDSFIALECASAYIRAFIDGKTDCNWTLYAVGVDTFQVLLTGNYGAEFRAVTSMDGSIDLLGEGPALDEDSADVEDLQSFVLKQGLYKDLLDTRADMF